MSSPALESKSSNLLQLLLCWLLQMAVPSVYQPIPIPVLYHLLWNPVLAVSIPGTCMVLSSATHFKSR